MGCDYGHVILYLVYVYGVDGVGSGVYGRVRNNLLMRNHLGFWVRLDCSSRQEGCNFLELYTLGRFMGGIGWGWQETSVMWVCSTLAPAGERGWSLDSFTFFFPFGFSPCGCLFFTWIPSILSFTHIRTTTNIICSVLLTYGC